MTCPKTGDVIIIPRGMLTIRLTPAQQKQLAALLAPATAAHTSST